MEVLPPEILDYLGQFLNYRSLVSLAKTSKRNYQALQWSLHRRKAKIPWTLTIEKLRGRIRNLWLKIGTFPQSWIGCGNIWRDPRQHYHPKSKVLIRRGSDSTKILETYPTARINPQTFEILPYTNGFGEIVDIQVGLITEIASCSQSDSTLVQES